MVSYYNNETNEFLEINEVPAETNKTSFDAVYEYHWTLSDILNPLFDTGLKLVKILEESAEKELYEENIFTEDDSNLDYLDWHINPKKGLPSWLTLLAKK